MYKLKSTGEKCFNVPSLRTDGRKTWGADYRRVCIVGQPNRLQIIHKSKLIDA